MKKIIVPAIIACLLLPLVALAHQPRIVDKNPYEIKNPEISQAFYGELKGQPQSFTLSSDKQFNFYVGVLSPDIKDVRKDFWVEVWRGRELVTALNPYDHIWLEYYEPFGGDHYFKGPETEFKAGAGTYTIKVYNFHNSLCQPDNATTTDTQFQLLQARKLDPQCAANAGRYSLAIGKTESFPISEILHTFWVLPGLKMNFFDKNPLMMFWNLIGLGLLVIILIISGIAYYFRKGLKRLYRRIR